MRSSHALWTTLHQSTAKKTTGPAQTQPNCFSATIPHDTAFPICRPGKSYFSTLRNAGGPQEGESSFSFAKAGHQREKSASRINTLTRNGCSPPLDKACPSTRTAFFCKMTPAKANGGSKRRAVSDAGRASSRCLLSEPKEVISWRKFGSPREAGLRLVRLLRPLGLVVEDVGDDTGFPTRGTLAWNTMFQAAIVSP